MPTSSFGCQKKAATRTLRATFVPSFIPKALFAHFFSEKFWPLKGKSYFCPVFGRIPDGNVHDILVRLRRYHASVLTVTNFATSTTLRQIATRDVCTVRL